MNYFWNYTFICTDCFDCRLEPLRNKLHAHGLLFGDVCDNFCCPPLCAKIWHLQNDRWTYKSLKIIRDICSHILFLHRCQPARKCFLHFWGAIDSLLLPQFFDHRFTQILHGSCTRFFLLFPFFLAKNCLLKSQFITEIKFHESL